MTAYSPLARQEAGIRRCFANGAETDKYIHMLPINVSLLLLLLSLYTRMHTCISPLSRCTSLPLSCCLPSAFYRLGEGRGYEIQQISSRHLFGSRLRTGIISTAENSLGAAQASLMELRHHVLFQNTACRRRQYLELLGSRPLATRARQKNRLQKDIDRIGVPMYSISPSPLPPALTTPGADPTETQQQTCCEVLASR